MKFSSSFNLNFEHLNEMYYKLLKEEDFNFKTKKIHLDISYDDKINVNICCDRFLDIKIATNALIKSLEIIQKTLNV